MRGRWSTSIIFAAGRTTPGNLSAYLSSCTFVNAIIDGGASFSPVSMSTSAADMVTHAGGRGIDGEAGKESTGFLVGAGVLRAGQRTTQRVSCSVHLSLLFDASVVPSRCSLRPSVLSFFRKKCQSASLKRSSAATQCQLYLRAILSFGI
jgi:hypothetical protein